MRNVQADRYEGLICWEQEKTDAYQRTLSLEILLYLLLLRVWRGLEDLLRPSDEDAIYNTS